MQNFKELEAYKITKQLAVQIYKLTQNWSKEETYGLTNQIRRAAVSVTSNLAEGCGRNTSKDSIQFLAIARGSCFEMQAQAEIAYELGFISQQVLQEVMELNELSCKLLNGLINRYQTRQ